MSKEMSYRDWTEVERLLSRRSLWIIHFCTGCGAMEMPAIMTSRYDMERFGIMPMATPRQADIMLVTGYVAVKTLKRIVRVYEQMQDPKYVVAFGSCPINGGLYWDSYNTIKQLDKYIPVDIYIAGCMPRPEAIMDALLKLMDMIDRGEADGWRRYKEQFEVYKANQNRVFKRWD